MEDTTPFYFISSYAIATNFDICFAASELRSSSISNSHLFLQKHQSKEIVQYTFQNAFNSFPQFSPNSEHILFATTRQKRLELYLLRTSGGEARPLALSPAFLPLPPSYCWSPQNNLIAISTKVLNKTPKQFQLLLYDIWTDVCIPLKLPELCCPLFPQFSHDGNTLYFCDSKNKTTTFYQVSLSSLGSQECCSFPGVLISWSLSSKETPVFLTSLDKNTLGFYAWESGELRKRTIFFKSLAQNCIQNLAFPLNALRSSALFGFPYWDSEEEAILFPIERQEKIQLATISLLPVQEKEIEIFPKTVGIHVFTSIEDDFSQVSLGYGLDEFGNLYQYSLRSKEEPKPLLTLNRNHSFFLKSNKTLYASLFKALIEE